MSIKIDNFKISASNCHKIMSGSIGLIESQTIKYNELLARKNDSTAKPLTANMEIELADLTDKKNNPKLPTGAITYLKEWFVSKKYNRKKDWYSAIVEKGLQVEPMSIELLCEVNGWQKVIRNDEWFENDFCCGIPDLIHENVNRDIKSSWDIFTFPMLETEMPDKDYEWQMHVYMDLTKLQVASLDYCLVDTPKAIIQQELKKLYYKSGGRAEDWTPDTNAEMIENFLFNDIPKEVRVKSFEVKRDENKISQIHQRVQMCRDYINTNFLKIK